MLKGCVAFQCHFNLVTSFGVSTLGEEFKEYANAIFLRIPLLAVGFNQVSGLGLVLVTASPSHPSMLGLVELVQHTNPRSMI